jgi:hypothetical protein
MDRGSCRGTHLDAAERSQLCHAGDPAAGNLEDFAFFFEGLSDGRIGIFCQADKLGVALFQGFSELFCPDYHLIFLQFRQIPALGDHTFFFLIHTDDYYTQFFKKVNKNF